MKVGTFGTNGNFMPVATLGPGVSLGEQTVFGNMPRIVDCIAHGLAELYHVHGKKFLELFESKPELGKALVQTEIIRVHALLEFIDDLRRLPLPVRVAKLLLSFCEVEQGVSIIDGLQSELANTLGVSRISLGKALKKLEARGYLEIGYKKITLLHVSNLSSYLKQHYEVASISAKL